MSKAKAAPARPAPRALARPTDPIPPTRPTTADERAQRGERGFTDTPLSTTLERSFTPPAPTRTATGEKIVPPKARPRKPLDEGPDRHLGGLIRVRATQVGFVDNVRRRVDDVFDVHEAEYSEKWMEPVDGDMPTVITGPKAALVRHHDDVIAGRLNTPANDPLGANSTTPRA